MTPQSRRRRFRSFGCSSPTRWAIRSSRRSGSGRSMSRSPSRGATANKVKKERADHRRHRQSALQGKGRRARRLDRERQRRKPCCAARPLDAAAANGASARTPSISRISTSISGAGRRGRCSAQASCRNRRSRQGRGRHRLLHHRGRVSERSRLPEDARRSAARPAREIWVIDCSPEGHQPEVPTRIFQGVQQPVCIVLAARKLEQGSTRSRHVCGFTTLPKGQARGKVRGACKAVARRARTGWTVPVGWRDPFLPAATGAWATFPALNDLFIYDRLGVMPGRTWIIAPDAQVAERRVGTADRTKRMLTKKELLFHPHREAATRHIRKIVKAGLGRSRSTDPKLSTTIKKPVDCASPLWLSIIRSPVDHSRRTG